MKTFESLLVMPDVSDTGKSGVEREYSEDVLEAATETLHGLEVVVGSDWTDPNKVIGEVTDAYYEEGESVYCEFIIDDEQVADRIESGFVQAAPRMLIEQETGDVQFDGVFLTAQTTEQVGRTTKK